MTFPMPERDALEEMAGCVVSGNGINVVRVDEIETELAKEDVGVEGDKISDEDEFRKIEEMDRFFREST